MHVSALEVAHEKASHSDGHIKSWLAIRNFVERAHAVHSNDGDRQISTHIGQMHIGFGGLRMLCMMGCYAKLCYAVIGEDKRE